MRLGIAAFRCRDGTIGWPPRGQRLYLNSSAARLSPCYCVNRAHLWISNAAEPPTAHGRDIIAVKPAQRSELLLTACRLTTAVQAIVSRNISICGHRTVLSVTTIQAGFRKGLCSAVGSGCSAAFTKDGHDCSLVWSQIWHAKAGFPEW
jgi:hypothetical protein